MQNLQATKAVLAVYPGAIVDNASWTSQAIDTIDCGTVHWDIMFGAMDIAMAALKIQECDTSGGSYTDITGADFSVLPATLPSATADNSVFAVDILKSGGRKRYQKVVATGGDGSAGTYMTALVTLDRVSNAPYDATTRGYSQALIVL